MYLLCTYIMVICLKFFNSNPVHESFPKFQLLPYNKDYSIRGSILGPIISGNYEMFSVWVPESFVLIRQTALVFCFAQKRVSLRVHLPHN